MRRLRTRDLGNSLLFNGSSDGVAVANDDKALNIASGGTVWAWFKLRSLTANQSIISKALNNNGWSIIYRSTGLQFEVGNGSSTIGSGAVPLNPGEWYFAVGTFDGTNARLYVNGVLRGTSSTVTVIADPVRVLSLGKAAGGSFDYCGGYVNSAGVSSAVLTAAQVANMYFDGVYPPSILYRTELTEGAGSSVADISGNNNAGTITGAAWGYDAPMYARSKSGSNLIKNGDFEKAPPFTAATSTNNRFVDGSSGGSATNSIFGWALVGKTGSVSAQFDTVEKYAGSYSLKLVCQNGGKIELSPMPSISRVNCQLYAIPVKPNTTYTGRFRMKTQYNTGDANTGAFGTFNEFSGTGSAGTVNSAGNVKVTQDWTQYTVTFTTAATARFVAFHPAITGNNGTGTLDMIAWFDDIQLDPVDLRVKTREFGQSLKFAGATTGVISDTSLSYTETLTLACWVKRTGIIASGISRILAVGLDLCSIEVGSTAGSGSVPAGVLGLSNSGHTSSGFYLDVGIWRHVCVVKNGTTATLYVDGVPRFTATVTAGASGTVRVGIDSSGGSEGLVGLIDVPRVWNVALTADQVKALYQNGIVPTANLLVEWRFDEGVGTSVADTSGNGNTGTINTASFSRDVPSRARVVTR